MKLNLLPTDVSKGSLNVLAMIAGFVIMLASFAAAFYMVTYSQKQVANQKARAEELKPMYDKAMATAKEADTIMAASVDLDRNLKLAEAMQAHNGKVAQLYDEVMDYVPSWFRMTNMTTTPSDQTTVVNLSGVLLTYQQYADMMLALARIPDVVTVGRSGFTDPSTRVPGLTEADQRGTSIKPGEGNLPSDPWDRFNELVARANAAPSGYLNTGNFGSGQPGPKGNMPDWSNVTFSIVMNRNTQPPDAGATLRAGGGAPAGTAPAGNAPAAGGNNAPANPVNNTGGNRPAGGGARE